MRGLIEQMEIKGIQKERMPTIHVRTGERAKCVLKASAKLVYGLGAPGSDAMIMRMEMRLSRYEAKVRETELLSSVSGMVA